MFISNILLSHFHVTENDTQYVDRTEWKLRQLNLFSSCKITRMIVEYSHYVIVFIHIFSTHLDNVPWPNVVCKYLSNEINIGRCHNNGRTFTCEQLI